MPSGFEEWPSGPAAGYQDVRLAALEFLEADVHHLSPDHRAVFLEPLVKTWDVDLSTFAIVVAVDHPKPGDPNRRFAMVEQPSRPVDGQSGFKAFRATRSFPPW